jgi:hypothetical protein
MRISVLDAKWLHAETLEYSSFFQRFYIEYFKICNKNFQHQISFHILQKHHMATAMFLHPHMLTSIHVRGRLFNISFIVTLQHETHLKGRLSIVTRVSLPSSYYIIYCFSFYFIIFILPYANWNRPGLVDMWDYVWMCSFTIVVQALPGHVIKLGFTISLWFPATSYCHTARPTRLSSWYTIARTR